MLADIIPIYLFINVYIFSLFIRLVGLKWWQALGVWALFQAVGFGFESYVSRDTLNGSIMYIPTYMLLFAALAWLAHLRHPATKRFAAIIGIFTVSLTFRTVDLELCEAIPFGTHFLWHLLNAVVLYRLTGLLIQSANGAYGQRPYRNTSPTQP